MSYPTYTTVLGNQLLDDIEDEIRRAREKFPSHRNLSVALIEEVGELIDRELNVDPFELIRREAIQVIAVAARIILEGDASLQGQTVAGLSRHLTLALMAKVGDLAKAGLHGDVVRSMTAATHVRSVH